MAANQLLVGEQTATRGSIIIARGDAQGASVVSELHGKDTVQALSGRMGFSTTLARATSLAATSQVGNIVRNPPGSGVNLALRKWSIDVIVASATCLGFQLGYTYQSVDPTGLTAADAAGLTTFGAGTTAALAFPQSHARGYAVATLLVAPVPFHILMINGAALNTVSSNVNSGDLDGAYIIPPGGIVAICAIGAAAAASGVSSTLTWEEIPITS